jgi:hypothetical protein
MWLNNFENCVRRSDVDIGVCYGGYWVWVRAELMVISDNLNSRYVWDFSYLHSGQEGSSTDFEALPP